MTSPAYGLTMPARAGTEPGTFCAARKPMMPSIASRPLLTSTHHFPLYCPSSVSLHLHSPHSHSPCPLHNLLMCSPKGVMQVSLLALHSQAVYPSTSHSELHLHLPHTHSPWSGPEQSSPL